VANDAHRGVVVEAAPFAAFEIAEPDPAFTHVWGKSRAGKQVRMWCGLCRQPG
jgi:hypothetical protein